MKSTIVFADNEHGIRRFCKQELEAAGYRVLLAKDGQEALDVVDAFAVDLVILDESMPCCSGLSAASRLKAWYPSLPVILFTADVDYEGFTSPLVDAAVIKSADLTVLKAIVVDLLRSATSRGPESDADAPSRRSSLAAEPKCRL